MSALLKTSLVSAAVVFFCFSTARSAKADPLLFANVVALQNGGTTRVDLFGNPGVILVGPHVNFLVDIAGTLPSGTTNTLLITYTEFGHAPVTQMYSIPFGGVNPPFTLLFSVTSLGTVPAGTMASLTIDIIGSSPDFVIPSGPDMGRRVDSYTYFFSVAPVPEPVTLLLFGTGLAGISGGLRWRRRSLMKKLPK